MKIYLWESMCATFPNKYSLGRYHIKSWKDLFQRYLQIKIQHRQNDYVGYVMENRENCAKLAKDVFKLRKYGFESLLDPRDFETFYH